MSEQKIKAGQVWFGKDSRRKTRAILIEFLETGSGFVSAIPSHSNRASGRTRISFSTLRKHYRLPSQKDEDVRGVKKTLSRMLY